MTDSPTPPSKREVMLALLEHAEAQVHLDARRDGVDLPDRLRGSSNVRLDYGYGLTPPIPDLTIDEDGIRATLSFNRVPHRTFIPWAAVFLIADFAGRGAVWRDDLPPELVAQADPEPVPEHNPVRVTERDIAPVPRRFSVLDGDVGRPEQAPPHNDSGNDDSTPHDEPEPPRPRPTLRLVK
jgi:hypothetical protein